MRKIFFLLMFLFLTGRVMAAEIEIRKEYYSNGQIKKEIPYQNGKIEGMVKEYDEYGNLLGEIEYKSGKLTGLVKWTPPSLYKYSKTNPLNHKSENN